MKIDFAAANLASFGNNPGNECVTAFSPSCSPMLQMEFYGVHGHSPSGLLGELRTNRLSLLLPIGPAANAGWHLEGGTG
jgi:hypothetical protein